MTELAIPIQTQKQPPVIYSTHSADFPFSDIVWNRPTHVLGEPNNFVISAHMKQRGVPLYVETPECSISVKKTGETNPLIKIGKKSFLDFLFTDVEWLSWLEHLEERGHKTLLQNQTDWFQTEMTEEDMENLFISPFKMVKGKGGKQFSVRTTFPLDKTLKIFDEKRQQVDYEWDNLGSLFTDETRFKTIVEVVGIKCSPRNFHLELEVKQIMMVQENPPFIECLISAPPLAAAAIPADKEPAAKEQQVVLTADKEPEDKEQQVVLTADEEPVDKEQQVVLKEVDVDVDVDADAERNNLLEITDFELDPPLIKEKSDRERAVEKMKNIRVLGMTEFLRKRGFQGENKLLQILQQ